MALCTSCGSQVEESASFCTSCGKPMPAAAHPSAAVSVARPVCSACGAQSNPDSLFCTECGKRLNTDPEPVAKSVQAVAADAPSTVEAAATSLLTAFCTNCGSKLESGTSFCTNCGQPVPAALTNTVEPATHVAPATPTLEATQPVILDPVSAAPASTKQAPTEPPVAMPASSRAESTPTAVTPLVEDQTENRPAVAVPIQPAPVEPIRVEPVPQVAPPVYATPTDYPPAQPGGGAFRLIVLVLLLLIVTGGFGGWYFMGVETVIVCSPPDVTVFLDNKELAPTSYGRYVISHLSRRPHLLKVQSPGFADTIERLDFPTTSLHEWVNIKLVPHRPAQPSRR